MVVAVICVGNEWQLDDGFGPAVASYLQERYEFPDEVRVLDRAVMGYAVVGDLMACDAAVVVDALDGTGADPGTLFSFAAEDMAPGAQMTSLHEVRFSDVLASAQIMGASCASGQCFGVQLGQRADGSLQRGLSEAVAASVAPCARAVVHYLERRYHIPVRDCWRASRDVRARLDDPVAYVSEALRALGASGCASPVLDWARTRCEAADPVFDFEADDRIRAEMAAGLFKALDAS